MTEKPAKTPPPTVGYTETRPFTRGGTGALKDSGWHLSEALQFPTELYPRLGAVAIDFRLR